MDDSVFCELKVIAVIVRDFEYSPVLIDYVGGSVPGGELIAVGIEDLKVRVDVELTVEEGIKELASIYSIEVTTAGQVSYQTIPKPHELGKILLSKIGICLPDAIPCRNIKVDTRKKLVSERKLKRIQLVKPRN